MSAIDLRLADILEHIARELRDSAGIMLPSLGDAEAVSVVVDGRRPRRMTTLIKDAPSMLLTAAEVGVMLGLDARTVRRRWREGKIPGAIQIGSSVRWRRKDIESWIAEQVAR